jgi:hypothetical protein
MADGREASIRPHFNLRSLTMLRRAFLGLSAILAFSILLAGASGQGDTDKKVEGKLVKVDLKASTLTIKTDADKTDKTYDVNDKTKFIGPKGGVADAGLKDDRLVKGVHLSLVIAGNNRTCREVHIPERKKKDSK